MKKKDHQPVERNSKAFHFNVSDNAAKTKSNAIQIPSINLPKGGGAVQGVDEKFTVNAVNGTATLNVPLPTSAARSLTPDISISYNSGSGNGIFGIGWSMSLSGVRRKTEKGLPKYIDAIDSDTFIVPGAEDLVPVFKREADGSFSKDVDGNYIILEKDSADGNYTIRFYKPRVEIAFARIERWSHKATAVIRWRVTTKENITTLYGWSSNAVIANPKDPGKIFEWLPEFAFDDKGNCQHYVYKAEDATGLDSSLMHNRNRFLNGNLMYTNIYPEKILYGNKTPYAKFGDAFPAEADYLFQTVFDYGTLQAIDPPDKVNEWDFRGDAFSDYKAGFEIRTTRLCKRVLVFHSFARPGEYSGLVKSLDFMYDTTTENGFTYLKSVRKKGYVKKADGTYTEKSMPNLEFDYQKHEWNSTVRTISGDDVVNAPGGLDEPLFQFIDLYNEGLSGILTEQGSGWYYKRNLGGGHFEPATLVSPKPSFTGLGASLHLLDLDGDGGKQLVHYQTEPKGYFELIDDEWHSFHSFEKVPVINWADTNTRMLDLNGDGKAEALISEDHVFTWYESAGRKGFKDIHKTVKPFDEELGAAIVFSDAMQSIFLADMSGHGLTDIVRIRNGEVCYWPNLGFGKFGSKVLMDNAPLFDHVDLFDPTLIRLADIDGSGTSDIIYLGKNKFQCWMNLNGNGFKKAPFEIDPFPEIDNHSKITVTDLLGNGVACIVYSSHLLKDAQSPIKYIDLMNSKKPHLLTAYKNNMGKEVSMIYKPSTQYYLEDKLAGKPWITKLHFPVHCISQTQVRDRISGYYFTVNYKYHHGYFDHEEKEFRGFGMVEQSDSESFEHWDKDAANNLVDKELQQEPVYTKTWFHTGAFLSREKILDQFAKEYWYEEMLRQGFVVVNNEKALADAQIVPDNEVNLGLVEDLTSHEWREALRSCKGMQLRRESFAKDAPLVGASADQLKKELTPYAVSTHNCVIELLQPKGQNKHAIFVVKERESLKYSYERNTDDPRILHSLNLSLDEYGNILESVTVVYPRLVTDPLLPVQTQAAQSKMVVICTKNQFTNDVIGDNIYRLRLASETQTFELKGVDKIGAYYEVSDFENILTASSIAQYHEKEKIPPAGTSQKRLIEHVRTTFYHDNLKDQLSLHQLHGNGLVFESYQLAYTPDLLQNIFASKANAAMMVEGKFTHSEGDDCWWIPSGLTMFIAAAENSSHAKGRFYRPISYIDSYGAETKVEYDDYFLSPIRLEDAIKNYASGKINYRTLSFESMRDINNNLSAVLYDELGLVKAMAVFGKGNDADDLTGLTEHRTNADDAKVAAFLDPNKTFAYDPVDGDAKDLLKHASTRFVYDFDTYKISGRPTVSASILREQYFKKNNNSPLQISFEYCNGLGQVIMKKVQTSPGKAKKVQVNNDDTVLITEIDTASVVPKQLRWIGNGRTILNNKGNPVKQYEPYFSATHRFEDAKELVESGVTPLFYYDPPGRLIKTVFADETLSKTEFNSWRQLVYDANDSILDSAWYVNRTNRLIDAELLSQGKDPGREKVAADKAAKHANTPTVQHFDSLGREVLFVEHNKDLASNADEFYQTVLSIDVEGNLQQVVDARGNEVMNFKTDMLGNIVYQKSSDSGQRWSLMNILNKPLRNWDGRNHEFHHFYDVLHRPVYSKVIGGDGPAPLDHISGRIVYGEHLLLPNRANEAVLQNDNLLGQAYRQYDTAGLLETPQFDLRAQALKSTRKLFKKYKETPNWIDANLIPDLETEAFTFVTETDALGRIVKQKTPDQSVITPSYNEGSLLSGERVDHFDPAISTTYIKDIIYNEKGQREKIIYGNDVSTRYRYDKKTFRLQRLETKYKNNDPLQDWTYTFDPVGNITHVEDQNAPLVFFNNQKVSSLSTYTYDALYRIVEATGRENSSALQFGVCDNWNDQPFMHNMNPGDPMAARAYTERYAYDAVGNIKELRHIAPGGNWTRTYNYEGTTNRLSTTSIGDNGNPTNYIKYKHHQKHGFLEELPHLEEIRWNFNDQIKMTTRQHCTTDAIPVVTYYQYDSHGQRVRKITENQGVGAGATTMKEERIYVSGYELYKKHTGPHAGLKRHSLSLMDDEQRFVMIETRNNINDDTEKHLVRYQLSNHLGSACLEIDNSPVAKVISYEEFHPFGTTAYQAKNASIKSASKRYRFTGMERDEETGLSYHNARYYIPWLARWSAPDPGGLLDGVNVYAYANNIPVCAVDRSGTQTDYLQAGKAWEKEVIGMIAEKIRVVEQVTVKAVINGKEVVSVLDALGIDKEGFVFLESKLSRTTELTAGQKAIREHLLAGGKVTISATDPAKVAELGEKLGVTSKTAISGTRYKVVHQGNVAEVLKSVNAIPAGYKTIIHASGKITVHSPEEMLKIQQMLKKNPAMLAEEAISQVRREAAVASDVEALALSRGMRMKKQGGFVRVGTMGIIAIVGLTAGIILMSDDKVKAAKELAIGTAVDMSIAAIVMKVGKVGGGVATIVTMVLSMESDSVAHNEAMAKYRMINEYIFQNYPGVVDKVQWCDKWFGFFCTDWQYEVVDSAKYNELYNAIENAINNPYEFEKK